MKPAAVASLGSSLHAIKSSRAFRWTIGLGIIVLALLGLVLLFLLTQATGNRELYERNYVRLFALNIVVASLLLLVIGSIVVRLLLRLRRGRFGSRLLVKLAAIFALVGLLPGLTIYVVSYQFVSRSIESWFDVRVEGALDAGLNLGRATLDALALDLANKTRQAASQLSGTPDVVTGLALERLRDQLSASDVVLWTASGQVIASVGDSRFTLNPERPAAQQFRTARSQRVVTQIEGLDELVLTGTGELASGGGATQPLAGSAAPARIKAIAVVNNPNSALFGEARFLQITTGIPAALVRNALAVQEANREYQERALARGGLRKMYIGTLTLSLFLAVFGAVLLAVILGNQLAKPLLVLADGVRHDRHTEVLGHEEQHRGDQPVAEPRRGEHPLAHAPRGKQDHQRREQGHRQHQATEQPVHRWPRARHQIPAFAARNDHAGKLHHVHYSVSSYGWESGHTLRRARRPGSHFFYITF